MSETIFVTGANGFLGGAVVKKFSNNGFRVKPIKNHLKFSSVTLWQEYVEQEVENEKPLAVINVGASQVGGDNAADIITLTNSNVICPSIIASTLSKVSFKTQFITIASSWQYGSNGNYHPFNLYAASKQALDDYLEHYAMDGLKITSLILFDTYSADDKRRKIHRLIADALRNKEKLDMTGGEQVLNLVHVEDAASAIFRTFEMRSREHKKVNKLIKWAIKSDHTIKVRDLLIELDPNQKSLFNLGGRPYRTREIFQIWEGFITVPEWTESKNKIKELKKLFNIENKNHIT